MSRISEIMLERRCSYRQAVEIERAEAKAHSHQRPCSARSSFEKWISAPPYERDTYRWPQDETKHAWPGQYKDIAVQLAWESWQQAQNAAPSGAERKP